MTVQTRPSPAAPARPVDKRGLTSAEVQERISRGDVNTFKVRVGRTYWQIVRYNLLNIFNLLLFVMLMIVLISQDYATVLFAGFSVVSNSLIGTIQEINAKRKLDRLAQLAPQVVHAWRDGDLVTIPSHQIVQDELIAIAPGDRLVVDGYLVESDSLEIDESHLTGESEPVSKADGDAVKSGSFCVAGAGLMVATRLGKASTVNQLSAVARVYKNTLTPSQQKIAAIVKLTLLVLAIFGPMIFISGHVNAYPFLEIVRNTVVFTTSLVPQGLILTTILSLTIGAVKISRHQTLIQRVNAVESLANVSVLCFDKTGTMTENRLTVTEVIPLADEPPPRIEHLLRVYVHNLAARNSTAQAIAQYVDGPGDDVIPAKQREIPFNSARKWGAIVLDRQTLVLGAPERVFAAIDPVMARVDDLSQQGLRVLAFASSSQPLDNGNMPPALEPLALVVVSDVVRHDIRETLQSFMRQEVRPKVISGDNLRTVRAVARQAGMSTDIAYTGDQIDQMPDSELDEAVQAADVFARVQPDTKRRIIAALRRQREYVAMVGDGVNDVPALKEADLAIAMNDGAQIAKDVSDIVLLNNAMSTLPLAFAEGTRITQTLFGTTKMFLTKNVYNTLLFIFVLFMSLPFPITPIQISWAAFGTVNIPAGLMALGLLRPSRIRNFRDDVLDYILTAGVVGAVGIAIMYLGALAYLGGDVVIARSATTLFFIMYSMTVLWHICGIDVLRPRTYFRYPLASVITLVLTGFALGTATLNPDLFEFHWPPLPVLLIVASVYLLVTTIVSTGMRNRGLLHEFYRLIDRSA